MTYITSWSSGKAKLPQNIILWFIHYGKDNKKTVFGGYVSVENYVLLFLFFFPCRYDCICVFCETRVEKNMQKTLFKLKGCDALVHQTRASLTFNRNSFEKLTINWNLFDLLQSPGKLAQLEGLHIFWVEKLGD